MKARTMLISIMYITESFIVISIRRINTSFRESLKDMNLFVWLMVLLGPIIHFLTMLVPGIQQSLYGNKINLYFIPFTILDYAIMLLFAAIPLIILELYKRKLRKKAIQYMVFS